MVRPGAQGRARLWHALLSLRTAPVLEKSPMNQPAPSLVATGLRHAYGGSQQAVVDLDRLELPAGATVALTGASGSGKTTLAYLLTGIERVQSGSVAWGGTDLAGLTERGRDRWRREQVGFV